MGIQILPPDINFSFQNFTISTIGYQITDKTIQKFQEISKENFVIVQLQKIKNQKFTDLNNFLKNLKNILEKRFNKI